MRSGVITNGLPVSSRSQSTESVLKMDKISSLLLIFAVIFSPVNLESIENGSGETEGETTTSEDDVTTTLDPWADDPTETLTDATTTQSYPTTTEAFSIFEYFPNADEDQDKLKEDAAEAEKRVVKMSEQIRNILASYREHGVITLPGLPIPDPMAVPDMRKTLAGSPINFMNNTVYGLSNFTVDHINTDIDKMQVFIALHIKRLVMLGNYSMKSWLSKANGPYNITLLDVEASGAAEIEKDAEGNLQASDTEMDMTFREAKVDLHNVGMMRGFLQGIVASAGPTLFDAVKPSILKEVNDKIRVQVNSKLKTLGTKFAVPVDDVSPIDKAVAEGRRYVRENGYDPYRMTEKSLEASPLRLHVSEFVLSGLSRFYRVGDVSLSMDKGNVQAGIHMATKRLYGTCRWNVSLSDMFNRNGVSHFTIKQLQVKAKVNQSLDVQQPPVLDDLDIFLGPIRLQLDKSESFNFVIEFVVNAMPALIRHIIVDTLEIPIKMKVQEILNEVDVEKLLNDTLPALDNMGLRR